MPLPITEKPTFTLVIPSTTQGARFRMMTRREEKLLLLAKTSDDEGDWLEAIRQVVQNCSSDDLDHYLPKTLDLAFTNLARLRAGKKLKNAVNPATGY